MLSLKTAFHLHKRMKELDEQLDKLGIEYKLEMEKERQKYFIDVLVKISTVFKCTKMINEMEEVFPMIKFLESFYDAGFYKGLNYGIDSINNMVVEDSDIPVRYADEISDEINENILHEKFG